MKSMRRGVLVACVITVAAVLGSLASPAGAAVSRASQPAKPAPKTCPRASYGAHHYAPGNGKTVALTFDDGPGNEHAGHPADPGPLQGAGHVLQHRPGRSSGRPTSVRAEVKAGYAMGDHTWDHANLLLLSASSQAREIDRMNSALRSVANVNACAFRPPYGNYNSTTLEAGPAAPDERCGCGRWTPRTGRPRARPRRTGSTGSSGSPSPEGGAQRHPVVLMHNQAAGEPGHRRRAAGHHPVLQGPRLPLRSALASGGLERRRLWSQVRDGGGYRYVCGRRGGPPPGR